MKPTLAALRLSPLALGLALIGSSPEAAAQTKGVTPGPTTGINPQGAANTVNNTAPIVLKLTAQSIALSPQSLQHQTKTGGLFNYKLDWVKLTVNLKRLVSLPGAPKLVSGLTWGCQIDAVLAGGKVVNVQKASVQWVLPPLAEGVQVIQTPGPIAFGLPGDAKGNPMNGALQLACSLNADPYTKADLTQNTATASLPINGN